MKNVKQLFKNKKFLLIATAAVILVIVSTMLLTGKTQKSEEIERPLLSKEMLLNVLVGPEELPWDAVLGYFYIGSDVPMATFGSYDYQLLFEEKWYGRPCESYGDNRFPESSIRITALIANSPEDAIDIASEEAQSYATSLKKVVDDENISEFADHAWGISSAHVGASQGARIIFTRGSVICDISADNKNGISSQLFLNFAAMISRKIDAALAGKPEPIPILPLTYQELQVDIDGAFGMRSIGAYLWGKDSKNIALYDVNGVARSLPAKQLSNGDYLVPLRHAGAILGPDGILEKRNELPEMKITMMGKTMVFYQNKSEILVNDKEVKLSRPIEFRGGEVLVPLTSLVQKALGKKISWSQRGSTMIGKVE